MNYLFINEAKVRYPKRRLQHFLDFVVRNLKSKTLRKSNMELTIALVTEQKIRSLNMSYRKKDYPTDILSFESSDPQNLGELVISMDVLRRQAREHKLTLQEETCYMLVHGVLHLLGYDHERDDKEAARMYRLQDKIFNSYFRRSAECPSKPKRRKSKARSKAALKK